VSKAVQKATPSSLSRASSAISPPKGFAYGYGKTSTVTHNVGLSDVSLTSPSLLPYGSTMRVGVSTSVSKELVTFYIRKDLTGMGITPFLPYRIPYS